MNSQYVEAWKLFPSIWMHLIFWSLGLTWTDCVIALITDVQKWKNARFYSIISEHGDFS